MEPYSEPFRPQFHFTPESGWMNDPNGMVYYQGEYHLFYQYTPDEIETFGLKYWGHAISKDLVHWEHLPVALSPDSLGQIWSGSVVVDRENTSGLQSGDEPVMVAIFTHYDEGRQHQSIAYSSDYGRTWTKYENNPVIPSPGLPDFRDPKVFWYQDTNRWVMVLAAGDRVRLYTSPNLIDWRLASEFGQLEGAHAGVWECPDLFPLKLDDDPAQEIWALLVSVGSGAPSGGSGTQYFLGSFDGEVFSNQYPAGQIHWLDYGKDNYAGVTFYGVPEEANRRIFIGWMSNWTYAYKLPTRPWRGNMTLPRVLNLVSGEDGRLHLTATPVPELKSLRTEHIQVSQASPPGSESFTVLKDVQAGRMEIITEIEMGTASQVGLSLTSAENDQVLVGYDAKAQKLFIDRNASGQVDFDPSFGRHCHAAVLHLESNSLRLHIFVDAASIEVFGAAGKVVLTDLIFPKGRLNQVAVYALEGETRSLCVDAWVLESIWG
jgi:fructan beta-fructosidase